MRAGAARVRGGLGSVLLLLAPAGGAFAADELCWYPDRRGSIVQVNGRENVPSEFQASARCFSGGTDPSPDRSEPPQRQPPFLPLGSAADAIRRGGAPGAQAPRMAAPSEISLDGNTRLVTMNSSLGPIELRWPRSVERLFGRTPERAMAEAARTASRALKSMTLPPRVRNLRLEWQVVFMESEPPHGEVPSYLRSSCHPGWMTPPANIYIVAERITGQCRGRAATAQVADAELMQLLVHEMGHAVEYYLSDRMLPHEAMRSEGFATWFESHAVDFSSLVSKGSVKRLHKAQASAAMKDKPGSWSFGYSGEDYSRASMYFHGIEERFGMPALLRIYERIATRREPFIVAATSELVITPAQLEDLAAKAAGR